MQPFDIKKEADSIASLAIVILSISVITKGDPARAHKMLAEALEPELRKAFEAGAETAIANIKDM